MDWSRSNPEWDGRLMRNGQMTKLAIGIDLAANVIIQKCEVELSPARQKIEAKL
ncbi:MAG: DNA sulfur modification protein DndB [Nitrosopumilus sp.]|nr:DNA sulfur modification protein DndB [Nitrosopumilus sp.]